VAGDQGEEEERSQEGLAVAWGGRARFQVAGVVGGNGLEVVGSTALQGKEEEGSRKANSWNVK
jgi:hypothetical protein